MILTDFHVHSTFSDGVMTIPELVDFYGCRGFGAIAITDHLCESKTWIGKAAKLIKHTLTPENYPEYIQQIRDQRERAWDQYGMVLFAGYEISKNYISNKRSAHILGIGIEEFIPADGDIYEIAKKIKNSGGFTGAAHPVYTQHWEKQTFHLWDRREEMSEVIDVWEATRGLKILDEVQKSRLPVLATSDLHLPKHVTSWKTVVYSEKHPEAILEAVRKQNVSFRIYDDNQSEVERLTLDRRYRLTENALVG